MWDPWRSVMNCSSRGRRAPVYGAGAMPAGAGGVVGGGGGAGAGGGGGLGGGAAVGEVDEQGGDGGVDGPLEGFGRLDAEVFGEVGRVGIDVGEEVEAVAVLGGERGEGCGR